ncbi:MAG TPA: hypothetical protein VN962_16405 [Polyangia bacterium]|nr:hypothetical protein [Polyangia bacterium]
MLGAVLVCLMAGCSASNASGGSSSPPSATGTGDVTGHNGSGGSSSGSIGSGGSGGTPLPPETEVESSYEVPVATGHYIWIANPDSGRVAYVSGSTLDVHTVQAGNAPTYISAIPSATDDAVVVLNVLSSDATILRVTPAGQLAKATVSGVAAGANALAVSPGGRWVIAWTDARTVANASPLQGFQAVTVIDLAAATPRKTILSVGFRPVAVAYAADESAAFAVTEDGVSVIDLSRAAGPQVSANVALTDDPTENADTRDVSITASGRLAVVRREGSPTVEIVDLTTGTRGGIDLSAPVTDVDLTADSKTAVAVVRDTAEVAVIPLAGGIPAADAVQHLTVTGETIGSASIAADGKTVLLYTNAVATDRLIILTLAATPTTRVVKLHAPVLAVFATPDGANAVVFHSQSPPPPPTTHGDAGVDAGVASQKPANAFSLVPLTANLPAAIQETDVPPQALAVSPAGDRVLITERDDVHQVYGVYIGQFPTLNIQHIGLASPPIAAGVLAGTNEGYVAQKNPEGRITFIALDTGQARTLTGFEIGARVVDWAQPGTTADGGARP